jgi:hypothetical protein
VQLELVEPVELTAAVHVLPEGTLELLHRAMTQQMSFELVFSIETRVAFVTGERQFTGMNQFMRFKIVLIAQPFAANITLESSLAVRRCHMFAQKTFRGKVAIAQRARIAVTVRLTVVVQGV